MELVLETHRKPAPHLLSEDIGLTRVVIEEPVYKMLEAMEQSLTQSNDREVFKSIDPADLHLAMPCACEGIESCKVRMYLDREDSAGVFHIVGEGVADHSLIYTDAVKVRMITV